MLRQDLYISVYISKEQLYWLLFLFILNTAYLVFRMCFPKLSYPHVKERPIHDKIIIVMSTRKVSFVLGEYYHLYNRGNSKQLIFLDDSDKRHFINLLYLSNTTKRVVIDRVSKNIYDFDREECLVAIGAYCLMPNHFHILITEKTNSGISKFMQKLTTAYSMYFNKKYNRTGALFEGKFKSQHLNTDEYLKYVFSYIHLNPVKLIDKDWKTNGIQDKTKSLNYLNTYQESSYLDYLEINRKQGLILDRGLFPEYFPNKYSFETEIFDWLSYNEDV